MLVFVLFKVFCYNKIMADYIALRKGRNILSSFIHVVLNILLGFGSIVVTVITGNWIIGIVLVLISKWRIFAVRPRYWWLNLRSNLVDLIVGASFVLLAFYAGSNWLPVHWILAVGYTVWLVLIKPRSSEGATEVQALIAVFLGMSAASVIVGGIDSIWLTVSAFIIGYASSRHILVQSDDQDFASLTSICGLVFAEIAWLCHSWLIVYKIPAFNIVIPQLAIVSTVIAFLAIRMYRSITNRDGVLRIADVAIPLIFGIALIAIMIIWFSRPAFDI